MWSERSDGLDQGWLGKGNKGRGGIKEWVLNLWVW